MTPDDASPSPDSGAVDSQSPWPGLEAFKEEDTAYFHGREAELDELHRLVLRARLTVLFGVSGLGKTSLLQAGLFPVLRDEQVLPVRIRLNYSEGMPALADQIKEAIVQEAAAAQIEAPSLEGTLWESFHREHADFWNARNRVVTPMLVFDQFEETFTRGRESPGRARDTATLMTELADLIEGSVPAAVKARIDAHPDEAQRFAFQRHNYKVLLSLREDFLADLEGLRHRLPSVMHNRLRLCAMNGEQALSAVTRAGGHVINEEVAASVVRFVGAETIRGRTELATLNVEPALLSVFCRELNLTRIERQESEITADLLEGRQSEILTSFYERGLAGIDPAMRAFIEDNLVTIAGRRNSEPYEEALNSPGVTAGDIGLLINRRILRIEDRAGMSWLELTHDRLTGVVRASRESRQQRDAQVAAETAEREARENALRTQEELDKKTRTLRLVRGLLVASVVGLVAAAGGAFFGFREQRRAQAAAAAERSAFQTAQAALADIEFDKAMDLVDHDLAAESLPYLSAALRANPNHLQVHGYTLSLLGRRNWPLPINVVHTAAEFESVRLSPDGKLLVTAARDGTAQLWDAATGVARGVPITHRGVVTSVGFSRDGSQLITSSEDGTARIWSVETGQPISSALTHSTAVSWAGLTPDATRVLTVSGDGAASVWDVESGQVLFQLRADQDSVTVARLSRDGRRAVTGLASGLARVWDVETGELLVSLVGHAKDKKIHDAQFSPNGERVITTSADSTARIWDAHTGRTIGVPLRHGGEIWDADFSPDGQVVVTASDDGTVGVWSAETGMRKTEPLRHSSAVYTLEFSPDGQRIVTTSADYAARVWDVATGQPVTERMRHGDWLEASFNKDGTRVITASWDKTLRFWDVRPSASAAQPLRHAAPVAWAQFSRSGRYLLTIADDHTTRVWDAETMNPLSAPMKHRTEVTHAEFSADESRMMTVTRDGAATAWSGSDWMQHHSLGAPRSMGFSADWSRVLAAASSHAVQMSDVESGRAIGVPLRQEGMIVAASISADGSHAATVTEDGLAQLWDTATGQPIGASLTDRGGISFVRFSPDGKRLLSASRQNTARVWAVNTGQAIGGPLRHYDSVSSAEFSEDGSRVVTTSRDMAFLWNADTSESIGQPMRQKDDILSAAFSRDGRWLVTASRDHTARVWDAQTGEPDSEPLRHQGPVRYAAFSANGELVITASDDGTARVWGLVSGAPGEAGILATLAEAVGGSTLNSRGIPVQMDDPMAQFTSLRKQTDGASGPGAPTFVRWFLADRADRATTPWAKYAPRDAGAPATK